MTTLNPLFLRFSESNTRTSDYHERLSKFCLYPLHHTVGHYFCQIDKEYNPCVEKIYVLGITNLIKAFLTFFVSAPLILIGKLALNASNSHRQAHKKLIKLLEEPPREYLQGTIFEKLEETPREIIHVQPPNNPISENQIPINLEEIPKPIIDARSENNPISQDQIPIAELTHEAFQAALRPDPRGFLSDAVHTQTLSPRSPKVKTPLKTILEEPGQIKQRSQTTPLSTLTGEQKKSVLRSKTTTPHPTSPLQIIFQQSTPQAQLLNPPLQTATSLTSRFQEETESEKSQVNADISPIVTPNKEKLLEQRSRILTPRYSSPLRNALKLPTPRPWLIDHQSQTTPLKADSQHPHISEHASQTVPVIFKEMGTSPIKEQTVVVPELKPVEEMSQPEFLKICKKYQQLNKIDEIENFLNQLLAKVKSYEPETPEIGNLMLNIAQALFLLPESKIVTYMMDFLQTSQHYLGDVIWVRNQKIIMALIDKLKVKKEEKPFTELLSGLNLTYSETFNLLLSIVPPSLGSEVSLRIVIDQMAITQNILYSFYSHLKPAVLKKVFNDVYPEILSPINKKFRIMEDLLLNWRRGEFEIEPLEEKRKIAGLLIEGLEIQTLDATKFSNYFKNNFPAFASCKILSIIRNGNLSPIAKQNEINIFLEKSSKTFPEAFITEAIYELVALCSTDEITSIMDLSNISDTSHSAPTRKVLISGACFENGDLWPDKITKMCEQFKILSQKGNFNVNSLQSLLPYIRTEEALKVILGAIQKEFGKNSEYCKLLRGLSPVTASM